MAPDILKFHILKIDMARDILKFLDFEIDMARYILKFPRRIDECIEDWTIECAETRTMSPSTY